MKITSLLAVLSLAVALQAHADDTGIMFCATADDILSFELNRNDSGVRIDLHYYGDDNSYYQNIKRKRSSTKQVLVYEGTEFKLEAFRSLPKTGIGYPSHLTMKTEDGQGIDTDLYCDVY